jgi:hypothetical protein
MRKSGEGVADAVLISAELSVDAEGLVKDYPPRFRRLWRDTESSMRRRAARAYDAQPRKTLMVV